MRALRLVSVFAVVAAIAYAAGNPDPVRDQVDQFRWKLPQFFNQEVDINFLDGGVVNAVTVQATTVTATTVASTTTTGVLAGPLDGGGGLENGDLQVLGRVIPGFITSIDGGSANFALDVNVGGKIKKSGVPVLVAHAVDGGTAVQSTEVGWAVMANGAVTVTFQTAFAGIPICNCTHVDTTNTATCTIDHNVAQSASQTGFAVASGGTDRIHWSCTGDK